MPKKLCKTSAREIDFKASESPQNALIDVFALFSPRNAKKCVVGDSRRKFASRNAP